MTAEEAAREIGESRALTEWLISVGRIESPVTPASLRRYREAETATAPDANLLPQGRIEPGTLTHLWNR